MRRLLLCLLTLVLSGAILTVTPTSAQAVTACDSNQGRTHSTSWREGRVYVRSCSGSDAYGVVGITDLSPLNLQLRDVEVETNVYTAWGDKWVGHFEFYVLQAEAGRLWRSYAQTRCGLGICPDWRGTPGTTYYTVTTVSYDVKDDGKGYFFLRSVSPDVRA